MPATLRWRDRMGLLMRQYKWKYLSRSWGFWRTQLLEILAGSMQEASNLTGCFWGCCAWGARLSTGRGTKSTSLFGICQVSVGHIGIRWILPSSGTLRRPVAGLWGSWQGTGSLSTASQKFTGTKRVWTEKLQEDLETGPGVQWWWFQKRSVNTFPAQTCLGQVVVAFWVACCWPAQQPWSESWVTFSVRIEVITQTCSRCQNHILVPT